MGFALGEPAQSRESDHAVAIDLGDAAPRPRRSAAGGAAIDVPAEGGLSKDRAYVPVVVRHHTWTKVARRTNLFGLITGLSACHCADWQSAGIRFLNGEVFFTLQEAQILIGQ
jgi:hypothetical protein